MEFESKIEQKIWDLRKEISRLEEEKEKEVEQFTAQKKSEGWKFFRFFSSYYGSHPEYGEDDEERTYLFHPELEISQWTNAHFSHGHHGQNETNDKFEKWLSDLAEDQYIVFD